MSRITLKPLDDGQKAVEIPVGKTTIGRGPFLGVCINRIQDASLFRLNVHHYMHYCLFSSLITMNLLIEQ